MSLVKNSKFIVTDSGGIQEETTYLNIPCLTLRDNTERPVTVELGSNVLVNSDTVLSEVDKILSGNQKSATCPEFWDGQTAKRVADDIYNKFVAV